MARGWDCWFVHCTIPRPARGLAGHLNLCEWETATKPLVALSSKLLTPPTRLFVTITRSWADQDFPFLLQVPPPLDFGQVNQAPLDSEPMPKPTLF